MAFYVIKGRKEVLLQYLYVQSENPSHWSTLLLPTHLTDNGELFLCYLYLLSKRRRAHVSSLFSVNRYTTVYRKSGLGSANIRGGLGFYGL